MPKAEIKRPEWETCCAEPHADEVAMLRNHLDGAWREYGRVNDSLMRHITNQRRESDDIYAAAKRAAWTSVLFNMRVYVWNDASRWIHSLIYTARQLTQKMTENTSSSIGGRPKPIPHADLVAALDSQIFLAETQKDELTQPESMPLIAELLRMRDAMHAAGERLHAEYGTSNGERCGCPGCEMTRGIYNSTLPEVGFDA